MKTKLGISVGLLGFILYLTALFGGFMPTIILTGYIMLFEENPWIKRASIKAIILLIVMSFMSEALYLIPDFLGWIENLVELFSGQFNYLVIRNIISLFTTAISICKTCLFMILAIKALKQGTINLPITDKIMDQYF